MPTGLLLVDAGYLIGGLLTQVGAKHRADVAIDYNSVCEALAELAEEQTGRPLLRQTWYDGARGTAGPEHRELASQPGVHVTLGWLTFVNGKAVQKGVDGLIVRDLVLAAALGRVDDVILLAGDADLAPGLAEAAGRGLRTHVWDVYTAFDEGRPAGELVAVADRRLTIDLADLAPHVRLRRARPAATIPPTSDGVADADSTAPTAASLPDVAPAAGLDTATPGPAETAPEVTPAGTADVGAEDMGAEDVGAEDAATTAEHILRSPAAAGPQRASVSPPLLRARTDPATFSSDVQVDLADQVDPTEAGRRYASRWWDRCEPDVRDRFLMQHRGPSMPRGLYHELVGYAFARSLDASEETVRKALRVGFWEALEAHRSPAPARLS